MSAERIRSILRAREPRDLLPTHPVTQLTQHIKAAVADKDMNHAIAIKAARAVVDGQLSQTTLVEILAALDAHRRAGTLRRSAGAFFCGALKKAFARNGITW